MDSSDEFDEGAADLSVQGISSRFATNYIRPALNVCVALSRYVLFILFL